MPEVIMSVSRKYITEINFFVSFRHILAILHFNENLSRETMKGKDGSDYIQVTYPKFKLGEEVVRDIRVPPTYSK